MKAIVVYDSKFGNTERVARVIAETLGDGNPVPVVRVDAASKPDLAGIDLLAVGGPTQAHGASPALRTFLDGLSPETVHGVPLVTFDTRLTWPAFIAGSAARVAAKRLTQKGAKLIMSPESFRVEGTEGPLVEGEVERAKSWATEARDAARLIDLAAASTAP